jgi:hypothetical protein
MGSLINFIEESKWMKYRITVGDEEVKIDLNKELVIDEDDLTNQVLYHPRLFGFLSRIHKTLVRDAKIAELNRKKVKATRIDFIMGSGGGVSAARESVEKDQIYIKSVVSVIKAEYRRDTLESILDSFKQRKDLIQTLSANLRSER